MKIKDIIESLFKREQTLEMPTSPPSHPKKGKVYLYYNEDGSFVEEPFSFIKEKERLEQNIKSLEIDNSLEEILLDRVNELSELSESAYFSSIFLSGSILEGVLYGLAQKYPRRFNENGPKPNKLFKEWSLSEFLNASQKLGLINKVQSDFSIILREYRNTIHPREQIVSNIKTITPEDLQVTMFALEVVISKISANIYKLTVYP